MIMVEAFSRVTLSVSINTHIMDLSNIVGEIIMKRKRPVKKKRERKAALP